MEIWISNPNSSKFSIELSFFNDISLHVKGQIVIAPFLPASPSIILQAVIFLYLWEPIGGKSSGSSILILDCATNGDNLSLSFAWPFGNFFLRRGDDDGEEYCSCNLSLRVCERGVTSDDDGVFWEENKFPLERFFEPCCDCSVPDLIPLVCETGVFLGVNAAFWRGVKWCDVFSRR